MSDTIIRLENLAKKYVITHQEKSVHSYKTFRRAMTNAAKSLVGVLKSHAKKEENPRLEDFWALKDVSFEVKPGDRVSITDRNGSGKSTLLKILSRVTEPTSGTMRIKGRVASLLEVGTGSHPELTRRENIFLNGSILGMSKAEIQRKIDEIVAFAEVERFLDTPVRRYSSGMYVRLAFAVTAYLEPEILIVDEVLAVGDAQFQKKCLTRMEDVGKEGRTVLFVSHNMGIITQLCQRAIYLKGGEIADMNDAKSVVLKYLNDRKNGYDNIHDFKNQEHTRRTKKIFLKKIYLINNKNIESSDIDVCYPFYVNLECEVSEPLTNVEISIDILTGDGIPVTTTGQLDHIPEILDKREIGIYRFAVKFPGMFFMPGAFMMSVTAHKPMIEILDLQEQVLRFNIIDTGTKLLKYNPDHSIGVVMVESPWQELEMVQ